MNRESIAQLRAKAVSLHHQARLWVERVPVKARVLLGLFLVAALLMAIHTALTAECWRAQTWISYLRFTTPPRRRLGPSVLTPKLPLGDIFVSR